MKIHLLQLTGLDPDAIGPGAGELTVYFSTRGYTDFTTGRFYHPCLKVPAKMMQSMFSPGATGGASTVDFAHIELINISGELDYLVNWIFAGYPCILLEGDSSAPLSSFSVIQTGTVEQADFSLSGLKLRFKDPSLAFKKPVLLSKYAGNNILPDGLEGGAELAGKEKPRLFGTRQNMSPVCVNTSRLIYQFHDGLATAVTAVRDNGVSLTAGSTRLLAGLQAIAPAAGTYDMCFDATGSYIRLGTSPTGPVTMAATVSGTLGQCIRMLALERGATVVEQSLTDLDNYVYEKGVGLDATTKALKDMPWGFYTGQKGLSTGEVLDALSAGGIWWSFDNLGYFWAKQLKRPEATALLELTTAEVLTLDRVAANDSYRGLAPARTIVRYRGNDTLQPTLAGSVYAAAPAEALYYAGNSLSVEVAGGYNDDVLGAELLIDSVIQEAEDAEYIAWHEQSLRSGRCDRLRVSLRQIALQYSSIGAWDDEAIPELPIVATYTMAVLVGDYVYVIAIEPYNEFGGYWIKGYRLRLTDAYAASWEPITNPPAALYSGLGSLTTDGSSLYLTGNGKIYSFDTIAVDSPWVDTGVALPFDDGEVSCYFNGVIYLLGGYNTIGNSAKGYAVTVATWAVSDAGLADYPTEIIIAAGILIGSVWYVGGGSADGSAPSNKFYSIDLASQAAGWASLPDLPRSVFFHSFALSANSSKILMLGGTDAAADSYLVNTYDIARGEWRIDTAPLPAARRNPAVVTHASGIYVIGGYTGKSTIKLCSNSNPADRALLSSIGRTVKLTYPRYGYTNGQYMRIIGAEPEYRTRKITLELWGPIV